MDESKPTVDLLEFTPAQSLAAHEALTVLCGHRIHPPLSRQHWATFCELRDRFGELVEPHQKQEVTDDRALSDN